jgi:hypothetical protein
MLCVAIWQTSLESIAWFFVSLYEVKAQERES